MAWWPAYFTMLVVKTYEGDTYPIEFLRVYETTIEAAGGDDTAKVKSITLTLTGVVLAWFFAIPLRSIYAWEQLRDHIYNNFQGKYIELKDAGYLLVIKQASNESLCNFFKRFAEIK